MGKFKAVVFDLGDVLISWTAPCNMEISPYKINRVLSSEPWADLERGEITEQECFEQISKLFSDDKDITPDNLAGVFKEARESTEFKSFLSDIMTKMRNEQDGSESSCFPGIESVQLYAMSNMAKPHYDYLATKFHAQMSTLFDKVFISAEIGMRKPELRFYKHVLSQIEVTQDPSEIIFVDDKAENVLAAQSLGMHGIVFQSADQLEQDLVNLLGDPVKRGIQYLTAHADSFDSTTNVDVDVEDNFLELLILEVINNFDKSRDLVRVKPHVGRWNFFNRKPEFSTKVFPDDTDTTSLAYSLFPSSEEAVNSILDEMLEYRDKDGIVLIYYDHTRMRTDAVGAANALNLFLEHGRGKDVYPAQKWVHDILRYRAYMHGTRYYLIPEIFLYQIARLCKASENVKQDDDEEGDRIRATLKPLLIERIKERIGAQGDALTLGIRISTCNAVGVDNKIDRDSLVSMQCKDGGWPLCWIYRYGMIQTRIGSRRLTTAFALKALSKVQ